jgi:hypothetical protein
LWEEIENLRCAKRDLEGEVSNLKEKKVENDEKVKKITIFESTVIIWIILPR